jgi:antitoxin (DNA-binding transcriptional repressor) of toxin-antitoxin stability system
MRLNVDLNVHLNVHMQYMSTTELRNKMAEMVAALKQGKRVKIIHRSEVLGTITPETPKPKIFDAEKARKALAKMKPRKLISIEDRDKVYRANLEAKYGKRVP